MVKQGHVSVVRNGRGKPIQAIPSQEMETLISAMNEGSESMQATRPWMGWSMCRICLSSITWKESGRERERTETFQEMPYSST